MNPAIVVWVLLINFVDADGRPQPVSAVYTDENVCALAAKGFEEHLPGMQPRCVKTELHTDHLPVRKKS
jgi:hypothetical protein